MKRFRLPRILAFMGVVAITLVLIVACERPDPQDSAAVAPTLTPTTAPSPTIQATQLPVQVYVVVIQPTLEATPVHASNVPAMAPTTTTIQRDVSPPPEPTLEPTSIPENYFLGWAWNGSLINEDTRVIVDRIGIVLRDRPAQTGLQVGVVMGYAEVIPVGRDQCGYTPVLVHAYHLLTRTTPHPEVWQPEPMPTKLPPFAPTPFPVGNATTGWAFTDALTVLGETAITGPLGINLRSEPCQGANNLGFIPAGSNIIVIGPAKEQYTPVRVNNDVLQIEVAPPEADIQEDDVELPVETATLRETLPSESGTSE